MLRTLRLAWSFFIIVLKRRLAYRGDLLIQSMDELLRGGLALVMLQVYLAGGRSINGWSEPEMLFLMGFAMVPIACFHCFGGNLYQLSGRYLIEGHFDRVLLRPYPTFLQICFDRISIEDLSGAALGIAVMVVAAARGGTVDFDAWGIALLVVMLLSAFAIVTAVFMAFAATSFWFEDRIGMVPPVYNLMEFGRWPIGVFPWMIKLLITLFIPFAFTAFYPASLFLASGPREDHWAIALCTPLVALVALFLASLAWRAGVRRYGSTGN